MASIDVHGDVRHVERLKGISDTLLVAVGRVLAGLLINVGDQVGKRIGLDDKSNGGVLVAAEDLGNGYIPLTFCA